MSSQEHIEVAPRMWDKSIAASYAPKGSSASPNVSKTEPSTSDTEVVEVVTPATAAAPKNVAIVGTVGIISKLKQYLIPIALVLGVIMIGYILWTYFTKYRKPKDTTIPVITEKELKPSPAQIISSMDTSKYEVDSDDESVRGGKHLFTIEEGKEDDSESGDSEESEDDDDEEGSDEDEESCEDDSEDDSSDEEEPDLDEIEQMIHDDTIIDINDTNTPTDISDMHEEHSDHEYGNTTNAVSFEIPSYITNSSKSNAAKKPRRIKRVTL